MAPNFFGTGSRETPSIKYFQIRLDDSNLILRGSEDEASSVILKGTVVLCLSEPLRIQGIRLRFTGERRLSWQQSGGSGPNLVKHEETFLRKTWDFAGNGRRSLSENLPAGNYEYPFDMILPGSTPESVEGLPDNWIIYRLKATIERGILQQNAVTRQQVRVIRTLDTSALELAHAMSVENVWPEKVDYSLSTPTKAVIFGTNVQVDFRLIPLLKGLRFGKITIELNQKQEMTIKNQRAFSKSRQITRLIAKDEYCLPRDAETAEIEGQEGYAFSRIIPIPQSLKQCLQTVEALGIKVRHNLSFNVQMHNPDGHVSELHATLPIYVFLSPNMAIDEDNNLINQRPRNMSASAALDELTPPQYGEHQFDQLYSDIDLSGYLTPAGSASGVNTPIQLSTRSGSMENLASLDGMTSSGFAANVLQTRLSSLDVAGSSQVARDRQLERSQMINSSNRTTENNLTETCRRDEIGFSPPNSLPRVSCAGGHSLLQQAPDEDEEASDTATPQHIEYCVEDLAKVPSYKTALKSQARLPMNADLPTYQIATCTPRSSSPILQPP